MNALPQALQALLARLGGLALVFALGMATGAWLQASRGAASALQQAQADTRATQHAAVEATAAVAGAGADVAAIRSNAATVIERIGHAPLAQVLPLAGPTPRPAMGRVPGTRRTAGQPHAQLAAGGVHSAGGHVLGAGGRPGAGAAAAAAAPAADAADAVPGRSGDRAGAVVADAAPEPDGAGGGFVVLSLAAVSLWNSALAGQAVPAGACRADDTTSEACAAASGTRLEDAWVNHATNAASCAADRARYQRLIDYLHRTSAPR